MPFKNIIGQDVAIKALENLIAQEKARGSYLFLGPDGVGKRTSSIEFAKAINCKDKGQDACCDCVSCNKIDSGNHPDVFLVHPEGTSYSIKIAKIREIIYEASLKPYEARKRVFIINDAEGMTEEAQNAFLRLLEEPPRNHIFILTVSNSAGLLPTVLSRCKILKFYLLSQSQIQENLLARGVDAEKAMLYSHMAMGSLGHAVKIKEENIIARRDQMVNDFFLRKTALLHESVLKEARGEDLEGSLFMLLYWYRDLLVSKFTEEPGRLLNIDRSRDIASYAARFSEGRLVKDLLNITRTIGYIRQNVNPKIALFNMAVELKRG